MLARVVWDKDDPYIKRILEELGKGMVRHRLIKLGRWLLQSNNETDGEDLLQEALILVCSRKKTWDEARPFFGHMARPRMARRGRGGRLGLGDRFESTARDGWPRSRRGRRRCDARRAGGQAARRGSRGLREPTVGGG